MIRKLLIVSCLLGPVFSAFGQSKPDDKARVTTTTATKLDYKEIGAPMPPLRMFTREGTYLTNDDLKNDANLILMLFNPTCAHCEDQTVIFRKNLELFRKSNIVLMAASGMGPYLGYFTKGTKIDSIMKFQVGIDSSGYIDRAFNYKSLPQINVYDKERKLIKTFNSTVPIDSLRSFIE